jgi:CRP-like cAMP-binding protein
MSSPSVELLQGVPLFKELKPKELQQLSTSFKERVFEPGETVVAEGEAVNRFFVIESGEAVVDVAGDERGRFGPGDYFGDIAMIDMGPRTATITADGEDFRPLVESDARIAWPLLQAMAKRLRETEAAEA